MAYESLVAAAIGFAPPIVLLLLTLQNYTYPRVEQPYFQDPKLFGLFSVGIIIGVVLYVVSYMMSAVYLYLGFLLEESIKLLILNLPRFQRRVDTAFYGFGLGAGMASSIAFGSVFFALTKVGYEPLSMILMIVTSVQYALLQASTGTTIGIGVARGQPWPFFGQAAVVHFAFAMLLVPTSIAGQDLLTIVLLAVATVFIATYYWYTCYRLLPMFIREALSKSESKARKIKTKG